MPNYTFTCINCNTEFTDFLTVNERNKKIKCPRCKSKKTQRMISSPYIKFEGSDWQTNVDRGIA